MKIKVLDNLWQAKQELVRTEVIPYQWDALNDNVEGAAPSYCMRNFRLAGELNKKRKQKGYKEILYPVPRDKWEFLPDNSDRNSFHGFVFQDTDLYKWIEAASYSLMNHPDKELEATVDKAIDIIGEAQLPDGYLDTLYIINNPGLVFTDLRDKHELYCFGHLCEAAVAYCHVSGKRKLLDITMRFADFIYNWFVGKDTRGYPGHEVAEMGLAKLYKETGNIKYLELAGYFINHRGERPYYFDIERGKSLGGAEEEEAKGAVFYDREETGLRYAYNQAHLPVRQQKEAVGHAVRGVYLYSGTADFAAISGDEELKNICRELFDNIASKKMYITGGIGSTHIGEAFTAAYDLPNDMAYSESCASIGLVFFAYRMLCIEARAKYSDVMERALYNCILAGMAEDGKSFFYVNPLEVNPERIHGDERMMFVKTVRQKWFGCACCPPNIARMLSSLGDYITTENPQAVYVHLFIASDITLDNGKGTLHIDADLTQDGRVAFKAGHKKDFTLAVRVPFWGQEFVVLHNGKEVKAKDIKNKDGYLYFDITSNEEIEINFKMDICLIRCNPLVQENIGKVAVMRGPFVYCMESIDNGKHLHMLKLADNPELEFKDGKIKAKGKRIKETADKEMADKLYMEYRPVVYEDTDLTFIPYYQWANRGENEMSVYIRYE